MVYGTAIRLLGNPAEAEDVAQSVFLKAFERFGEIGSSPAAAGWLKTVATNLCLNHLSRYRARWQFFSELDEPGTGVTFASQLPADPPTSGDEADRQARLEQALQRLPDHQRVPLVLFHFDDLSYQAIAELLGVSLGKVKTDIHRGRNALRQLVIAPNG
jgi:RNA polymerase sigma-70 factor (ECF subfamily)